MKEELKEILENLSDYLTEFGSELEEKNLYKRLSESEDIISDVLEEM